MLHIMGPFNTFITENVPDTGMVISFLICPLIKTKQKKKWDPVFIS